VRGSPRRGADTPPRARQPAVRILAERAFSREYRPLSRLRMPVRKPEARRTRSGNSFGSANVFRMDARLVHKSPRLAVSSAAADFGFGAPGEAIHARIPREPPRVSPAVSPRAGDSARKSHRCDHEVVVWSAPLRPRPHCHFLPPCLTGVPYNSNAATFTYPPEPWPLPGIKSTKPTSSTLPRSGDSAQLEASPSGP
jgi:hypothetical protein